MSQLAMMVEIVRKYKSEIPGIIKAIKEKHIDNDEKEEAEMIFSTVHRCKGMEYDAVQIVNDFISEEKLERLKENKEESINIDALNEEINLLYVAVTRARNTIYIPGTLIPKNFPSSSQIHVIKALSEEEKRRNATPEKRKSVNGKTYSYEEIREKHNEAYTPWTEELDHKLTVMYGEGASIPSFSQTLRKDKKRDQIAYSEASTRRTVWLTDSE